jgi:hypothetical protein
MWDTPCWQAFVMVTSFASMAIFSCMVNRYKLGLWWSKDPSSPSGKKRREKDALYSLKSLGSLLKVKEKLGPRIGKADRLYQPAGPEATLSRALAYITLSRRQAQSL